MAIYNWLAQTSGVDILFDPAEDQLVFNDAAIHAAALVVSTDGASTTFAYGGKTVTLTVLPYELTTTSVTFANGSLFLVGDNDMTTVNDETGNTLTGGATNDLLWGGAGGDTINGGAGGDTLYYGDCLDQVFVNLTSSGVTVGAVTVAGGTALDGYGPRSVDTVSGVEHVTGGAESDFILGNNGSNRLTGGAGVDTLQGGGSGAGGDNANDTLNGGSGDDDLRQTRGNDVIDGGADQDILRFTTGVAYGGAAGVNVNLGAGTSDGDPTGQQDSLHGGNSVATVSNIEIVIGTAGNDTLTGGGLGRGTSGVFFESFNGGAGNDLIDGRGTAAGQANSNFLDRVQYSADPTGVNVNLADGAALDGFGGTDTLSNINWVRGSEFNDTIIGGNADNDGFERFEGLGGNDIIDGGSGTDEVSYTTSTTPVQVDLGAGSASDGLGGTDTLENIEIVQGSGFDDTLTGSSNGGEVFLGNSGDDVIDGGTGPGTDFASWANASLSSGGINAFLEDGSAAVMDDHGTLDTLIDIEGLIGTSSDDTFEGGSGNQTFFGRGGSDLLTGGAGTDTVSYLDDPNAVNVNLATGAVVDGWGGAFGLQGNDTLTGIENVVGSASNDVIVGSDDANRLEGRNGNDNLNGGAGNDTALGGLGNDTYTVNAAGDVVTELAGQGTDTVRSGGTWTLGVNLENLVLTGTGNINGTGSAQHNVLTGNTGNNVLNGGNGNDTLNGGAGNDTLNGSTGNDSMVGGAGDDIYVRNTAGDVVTEAAGQGNDLVQSAVTYTLAVNVERLTLTGTGNVNATGNGGNNILTGNAGNNALNGTGGADTLNGLGGDDTLVWDAADTALNGGAGTDTLRIVGTGQTLNLLAVANTKIVNMEIFNITGTGNNRLELSLQDVLDLSASTNTLRVDGNAGDTVDRNAGWTQGANQVIGANTYFSYTQGAATLLVDTDITSVT